MRDLIFSLLLCGSLAGIPSGPPPLEKPDLSPELLRDTATHVVVGEVRQIWSREESTASWDFTHSVAEIAVESVEKGDGLQPGELVYARYWRKRWDGWGTPPPGGYRCCARSRCSSSGLTTSRSSSSD